MSVSLVPRTNRVITTPHSKMRRLLQEVAVRGGGLCSFDALVALLEVAPSNVSGMFGSGKEHIGSVPPDKHLARIVAALNREGIPIHVEWFYQPLEVFDALLSEARGANPAIAYWRDITWRFARAHPALGYERPETRGFLRRAGAPPRPGPERLRVGERIQVRFDPPDELASGAPELHAIVIADGGGQPDCLFPVAPGGSAITRERLLLPGAAEDPFEITPPLGVQHVYAVLTRFAPAAVVHAELMDLDLRAALDVLASELSGRPQADWAVYHAAVEVVGS